MLTDERRVRKELYEGPGGNLVDGLPPFPSFPRNTPRSFLLRSWAPLRVRGLYEEPGGKLVGG